MYLYTNDGSCTILDENENDYNSTSPIEARHLSDIIGVDLNQNDDMMDCHKYNIWDTEEKMTKG